MHACVKTFCFRRALTPASATRTRSLSHPRRTRAMPALPPLVLLLLGAALADPAPDFASCPVRDSRSHAWGSEIVNGQQLQDLSYDWVVQDSACGRRRTGERQ